MKQQPLVKAIYSLYVKSDCVADRVITEMKGISRILKSRQQKTKVKPFKFENLNYN